MTPTRVDSYLQRLNQELRARFIVHGRLIDEARDHLVDAVADARAGGASLEAAEAQALARFGPPEVVAEAFAADWTRTLHRGVGVAAVAFGAAIAYGDARPTWDDTGITAGAMFLVAAALGCLGPRRAWRSALAVGMWIPVCAFVRSPGPSTLAMGIALVFPLAGACLGRGARRLVTRRSARTTRPA